tara:strand:- start:123 stop:248 length:126 start_codon:yes stop_codon:yes gene_type:complete
LRSDAKTKKPFSSENQEEFEVQSSIELKKMIMIIAAAAQDH